MIRSKKSHAGSSPCLITAEIVQTEDGGFSSIKVFVKNLSIRRLGACNFSMIEGD
jgi:hypothetical protein